MRVCVVAEYYPDRHDPTRGIWAHRQALAAHEAGAEVRVLALHRPLPPLAMLRRPAELARWAAREAGQPRRAAPDGIEVRYVRFPAPPRPLSYPSWGEWAAPFARRALTRLHREWPFDLVHAHYAIPAARAARGFARAQGLPLVVSVHGGDVFELAARWPAARRRVAETLREAPLVLCNSALTLDRVAALGVGRARLRVVRLGASAPDPPPPKRDRPTLVSCGYLVPRKRHADVLRALATLRPRFPELEYLIVGDGPERPALERLARELGVAEAVEFAGRLEPDQALRAVAACHLMVMPSLDEAFGVVYAEAMVAGVPAIGCAGEGGPEEIAALGKGLVRVPPLDPDALAEAIAGLLAKPKRLAELGERARITARDKLSWEACGRATVDAYREAAGRS